METSHSNVIRRRALTLLLCEKLMRELNKAYEKHKNALQNDGDITDFLRRLCELFQYEKLNETVLFFLKQRAAYPKKEEPDLCVDTEREERHTARIFETLLFRGKFYSVCAERWETENPIKTIARILGNTVAVYSYLYRAFLKHGEYISWWKNVKVVNEDGSFRQMAEGILKYAGYSDLRETNLRNIVLRHADLYGVNLFWADLRDADLRGADLRNANFCGADLHRANLQDANLQGSKLRWANLSGANLCGAEGYNLEGTIGSPITGELS